MNGQTVTRFVVKRGDKYVTDNSEDFWGPICEAKLWKKRPDFSYNVAGDNPVMVSVTIQELPYEVK